MKLITVVIPIYNTEQFLKRCIQSVLNQSYKNIEILLVDDGSKDKSGIICDEVASLDHRIRVIHKKNAGLGYARNTGIENANGEYICFVDSDDTIHCDMIEKLYNNMQKYNADTSYCSIKKIVTDGRRNVLSNNLIIREGVFSSKNLLKQIIGNKPDEKFDFSKEMSVCAALFSLDIIRKYNIRFCSERKIICEDLLFDIEYLSRAKKVLQINSPYYNYYMNENSLTHKYIEGRVDKEILLYNIVLNFIDNDTGLIERFYRLFLGRIRNCIIQEVKYSNKSFLETIKNIRLIISKKEVRNVLKKYPYYKNPPKQFVFNFLMVCKASLLIYLLTLMKEKNNDRNTKKNSLS